MQHMQVAEQQGKYLAKHLNEQATNPSIAAKHEPFKYRHMGSMATVGAC